MTEEAVKECFAGLLGFDDDSKEEEGLCEYNKYDKHSHKT